MAEEIYFHAFWRHDSSQDPSELLVVLDNQRYEKSKFEFYDDLTYGFCDSSTEAGGTFLSDQPYPSVIEINKLKYFMARELSQEEYMKILEYKLSQCTLRNG